MIKSLNNNEQFSLQQVNSIQLSLVSKGIGPKIPTDTKTVDAQVPYIKWPV